MRKVLFAGISAVALTLAFGSVAGAVEGSGGTSGSNHQLGQQNNNKAGGNVNDSSAGSGQQGNSNSMSSSNDLNNTNITILVAINKASVKADQDIKQENSKLGVDISVEGGNGGNANGGKAEGGDGGNSGGGGKHHKSASGDGGNGGNASGGNGGQGGGGGGGSVATGNATIGSFSFNAGVFNSAISTGIVNNANAATNIAANANNTFGTTSGSGH